MAPGARHPVGGRPRTRRTPAHRGRHSAPPPSTGRLSRHGGVRRTLPGVWRRRTRDATRVRGHRGRRCRHGCPGARRHPPGRLPPPSRRPLPRHGRMPGAARLAPEPGRPPVVADAVDDCRSHLVVAEDGPPPAGPRVGGRLGRLPLAGPRDGPGGRPPAARVGRQEDGPGGPRRPRPHEPGRLAVERPAAARPPGPHDQGGRREEPRLAHRLTAERAQRPRHVRPAASDVAHGHDVLVAVEEGEGRQPPRPRESGQATDPQSWPSNVLACGRAHLPGICALPGAHPPARSAPGRSARHPACLGVPRVPHPSRGEPAGEHLRPAAATRAARDPGSGDTEPRLLAGEAVTGRQVDTVPDVLAGRDAPGEHVAGRVVGHAPAIEGPPRRLAGGPGPRGGGGPPDGPQGLAYLWPAAASMAATRSSGMSRRMVDSPVALGRATIAGTRERGPPMGPPPGTWAGSRRDDCGP